MFIFHLDKMGRRSLKANVINLSTRPVISSSPEEALNASRRSGLHRDWRCVCLLLNIQSATTKSTTGSSCALRDKSNPILSPMTGLCMLSFVIYWNPLGILMLLYKKSYLKAKKQKRHFMCMRINPGALLKTFYHLLFSLPFFLYSAVRWLAWRWERSCLP